jgi:hypothetical protein
LAACTTLFQLCCARPVRVHRKLRCAWVRSQAKNAFGRLSPRRASVVSAEPQKHRLTSSTKLVHEPFVLRKATRELKPCWLAGTVSPCNRSQEETGLIGSTLDNGPKTRRTRKQPPGSPILFSQSDPGANEDRTYRRESLTRLQGTP